MENDAIEQGNVYQINPNSTYKIGIPKIKSSRGSGRTATEIIEFDSNARTINGTLLIQEYGVDDWNNFVKINPFKLSGDIQVWVEIKVSGKNGTSQVTYEKVFSHTLDELELEDDSDENLSGIEDEEPFSNVDFDDDDDDDDDTNDQIIEVYKNQVEELKQKNAKLESQNAIYVEEKYSLNNSISQLENQNYLLEKEIADLHTDINKYVKEIEEYKKNGYNSNEQITQLLKEQNSDLRSQLDDKRKEVEKLNVEKYETKEVYNNKIADLERQLAIKEVEEKTYNELTENYNSQMSGLEERVNQAEEKSSLSGIMKDFAPAINNFSGALAPLFAKGVEKLFSKDTSQPTSNINAYQGGVPPQQAQAFNAATAQQGFAQPNSDEHQTQPQNPDFSNLNFDDLPDDPDENPGGGYDASNSETSSMA